MAGLKHYLRKKQPNLLTIDLLCRGVPSPKVWERYIEEKLQELEGHSINDIKFRTKSPFYSSPIYSYVLKFSYVTQKNERKDFWEDCIKNPYYSYFMHHNFRPSCFRCHFRNSYSSGADITIGDAISDSSFGKEGDNNVSTIVIHSERGNEAFDAVSKTILYENQDLLTLDKNYQSSIRTAYWDWLRTPWELSSYLAMKYPLEKVRRVYETPSLFIRAFCYIKSIIMLFATRGSKSRCAF